MLKHFLEAKPLFYEKIDYERMPRIYATIKEQLQLPKIIHIIGTNGKGTTGRFLAEALFRAGKSVGHYTSPHILYFNERIWLNGTNASDALLENAHKKLLSLLAIADANALSYFEYTTLLALVVYENLEYVVLEAGLGGEHDATAVFNNILTLVTPIDRDHEAFLGSEIKSIAQTKLNALQTKAIVAKQKHKEVVEIAQNIAKKKGILVHFLEGSLSIEDEKEIAEIAKEQKLAPYLVDNLRLAVCALKELNIEYSPSSFSQSRLFGRLTQYKKNILLDVGHNVLAAEAISQSLAGSKYVVIYNSYKDKDYRAVLEKLRPIVESIELIGIEDERGENLHIMEETLQELGFSFSYYKEILPERNYLVFGSFSVVEAFLKGRDE